MRSKGVDGLRSGWPPPIRWPTVTLPATGRFAIAPAPGGLALVQDLLNTAPIGGTDDLLADVPTAQAWLDGVLVEIGGRGAAGELGPPTWAETPHCVLVAGDLAKLRVLRDRLRGILVETARALESTGPSGRDGPAGLTGAVGLAMASDGRVSTTPSGSGASWVRSAVLAECFVAQQHDSWRRLKVCRNPHCETAFYDRSRNNSGVWHNVHVCGNAANLRASRARRRAVVGSDTGRDA
jgi:hypothetical protein